MLMIQISFYVCSIILKIFQTIMQAIVTFWDFLLHLRQFELLEDEFWLEPQEAPWGPSWNPRVKVELLILADFGSRE